jgi:RNA polymerase sigma-70 factor, ECF subfamily
MNDPSFLASASPPAPAPPPDVAPEPPAVSSGSGGSDHEITRLIRKLRDGDRSAYDCLIPIVYDELRRIAQRQLRHQRDGHALNTTALVHEAYLKLVDQACVACADRAHFFGIAARAMRQILVDHARKEATVKRGGRWLRVSFEEELLGVEERAEMLLVLDEALSRLTSLNERLGQVVECRFFGGMTEEEVATALGLSERTVRREWRKARLWLYAELAEEVPPRDHPPDSDGDRGSTS